MGTIAKESQMSSSVDFYQGELELKVVVWWDYIGYGSCWWCKVESKQSSFSYAVDDDTPQITVKSMLHYMLYGPWLTCFKE